ncbi:hypothetical protein [Desulfofustis glycolicus]|uniref:Uncharacterized protein n=1 Tax=Desulfofustis glycolicus DSM 9705 TaxID=1121409 RepID=A0A1M5YQ81_9BACT|nr:hypothetical protein [Desulfofustis glycolicus]MCB2217807.1 hypothetical protein [Desulfobulbaceae bacterium]SHI13713.1 hypothetical protein SAMN02745124_04275 [Desulfofustis glycolicus DSM 9705]
MIKHIAVLLIFLAMAVSLSGCGALTGIPGHGGGKRFAVEQELVAAATRAAIKEIDVTSILGKKVNVYVNAIGDTGAGNLLGGRFSVISQLRGDYLHTPTVSETATYPRYTSTATTASTTKSSSRSESESTQGVFEESTEGSGSSSTSSSEQTVTDTMLPSPIAKRTRQKGGGSEIQAGVQYEGLGTYHNSEEITSNDLQYLSALLETYLFLKGVFVVPPSEAEIDVYVTVDVFGTVRTRIEWFLANNEILQARTSLEVMAVDHQTGKLVMPPQSAGAETEYNEQYILWAGPVTIRKYLKDGDPLLADFTDLREQQDGFEARGIKEQHVDVPYPFQHQF